MVRRGGGGGSRAAGDGDGGDGGNGQFDCALSNPPHPFTHLSPPSTPNPSEMYIIHFLFSSVACVRVGG